MSFYIFQQTTSWPHPGNLGVWPAAFSSHGSEGSILGDEGLATFWHILLEQL